MNKNQFLKTFSLKYPVIQSPMAGVSTPKLAARVTATGGMGSLPLGGNIENLDVVRKTLKQYEDELLLLGIELEDAKKVNLNFFCHEEPVCDASKVLKWSKCYRKYFDECGDTSPANFDIFKPYGSFKEITDVEHPLIRLLVAYKPQIISFHFGLPEVEVVDYLAAHGIKIFVSVTNPEEFKFVRENYKNVKGFILQNYSAGGHRGSFVANDPADSKLNLQDLLREITCAIEEESYQDLDELGLVLAGGITTREQIQNICHSVSSQYRYVSGVQLGSVFFLDDSVTISSSFKEFLLKLPECDSKSAHTTVVTSSISGRTLRTFETAFIKQFLKDTESFQVPDYPLPYSIFKTLASKDKQRFAASLVGENFMNIPNGNADSVIRALFE